MIISIGVLILIVVIVVFIIAGVKSSKKGDENMINKVYIYFVLFATLMMTIGGSVAVFMALADMLSPAPYYQSFEDYKYMRTEKPYIENNNAEEEQLTDEELRERYDKMVISEKETQINRAKNNLIKSLGWIIVPFPVFLYFQRRLVTNE
jgi:amino acid transporter